MIIFSWLGRSTTRGRARSSRDRGDHQVEHGSSLSVASIHYSIRLAYLWGLWFGHMGVLTWGIQSTTLSGSGVYV